jgi:flagellar FliL protein
VTVVAKKEKKKNKAEEPDSEALNTSGAEGEEASTPEKKKLSGKTLVLFVILPALLVIGGGGAATFMLLGGAKPSTEVAEAGAEGEEKPEAEKKGKKEEKKEAHGGSGGEGAEGETTAVAASEVGLLTVGEPGDPSYYKMPKMIVNLASGSGGRAIVMQLDLVLESADAKNFDEMTVLMPRLTDQFQTFLRELRVEDLEGSAGSYRLRLELLRRFNIVMAPAKIDAVLIEGMLIN